MNPKTILLSGATGYLGSVVLQRLLAAGYDIIAVTRAGTAPPQRQVLEDTASGRVTFVPMAERHHDAYSALSSVVRPKSQVHALIHIAAVSAMECSGADIDALIDANVALPTKLADCLVRLGGQLIVNTGSFWQHASGTDDYVPNSLYAASKSASETLFEHYTERYAVKVCTLKMFDIYGPHDQRPKLLNMLCEDPSGAPPLAMTAGEQKLDPVHIDDAARAYLCALQWLEGADAPARSSFGIRGGAPLKLKDLVAKAQSVFGHARAIDWGAKPYRDGDMMSIWEPPMPPFWTPQIDLETGLRSMSVGP